MTRWIFFFILLSSSVFAQSIADYPNVFIDGREWTAYVIKGDVRTPEENVAVNLAINAIPGLYRPVFRAGAGFNFYRMRVDESSVSEKVRLASEVRVLDRPAVIIGTPCTNAWVRRVLAFDQCNTIPANHAYVVMGLYEGTPVLVVTGGSPAMVLKASGWLHDEGHFRFRGKVARLRENGYLSIGHQIGYPGDMLQIGQPIGQVTPVITVGQYRATGTRVNSYLRFGGGRVVFGERD